MTKAELAILATTGAPAAILLGSIALAAREWRQWKGFLNRSRADQQYGKLLGTGFRNYGVRRSLGD